MIFRHISYTVNAVYRRHFRDIINAKRALLTKERNATDNVNRLAPFTFSFRSCNFCGNVERSYFPTFHRNYRSCCGVNNGQRLVLGIETSCDDTGAAIVNDRGDILGEALHSQVQTHVEYGGIVPKTAQALHEEHIDRVVNDALYGAQMKLQDLDAIAVTTKPGLALSLSVGLNYAKQLVKISGKPMIPIHHMEAHALTARMIDRIPFPFLVLLASGGHCLLAIAHDVDKFDLIGRNLDTAPGDTLDKLARRLSLIKLKKCEGLSGGASLELVAKGGNPKSFLFPHDQSKVGCCNFFFGSLRTVANPLIQNQEQKFGLKEGDILPNVSDICASIQYSVARQLARRLQRAMLFCEIKGVFTAERTLVVSGGVASNMYIRQVLQQVCDQFSCRLVCPPPKLCTDNGIMIAWNGMEKLMKNRGFAEDPDSLEYHPKCPLGNDLTQDVINSAIKLPKLKLNIMP